MSKKPLIVVSGATGLQGGSVVNSLLETGRYKIRALTRKPDSDKAKALAAKGIEVFKCDLSIKDDVKNALAGADIAWIVTNFWDNSVVGTDVTEEERQGKLIADAAKETGLNWLIYSSLPDSAIESDGKYSEVIHFIGKNRVEQYIRKIGIPNTTFVYLSFYMQNIGPFVFLVSKENGEVEVVFPYLNENDRFPVVDVANDTGPIVAKIIEDGPDKWNGKKVPVASEILSLKQLVDTLTKVTGKTHKLRTVNDEEIAKEFPAYNNEELKQMYKWIKDYGLFGKDNEIKDISITKKLYPNITTYEQYLLRATGKK